MYIDANKTGVVRYIFDLTIFPSVYLPDLSLVYLSFLAKFNPLIYLKYVSKYI